MTRSTRAVVGLLALSVWTGGCIGESSLEVATPVNLHVWTTGTSVEIDAPGWLTKLSSVYLCVDRPPRLPIDSTARLAWNPGDSCQDFGKHETQDGLRASIPVSKLDAAHRPAFEAAADWYVLLVALENERATSAISSRFHAPHPSASP